MVKARFGRLVSVVLVSTLAGGVLPPVAYAAPASGGDSDGGKGVVDTVKGWFTDEDDAKPPALPKEGVARNERQLLDRSKEAPKPKRVGELTGRRTPTTRFWQLSDGRVQAEVSAAPTSYRSGKSWKPVDTTVRASKAKGFEFANTTNPGKSWFGSDGRRMVRFQAPDGQSVTMGLEDAGKSLKPEAEGSTVTYKDAAQGADLSYQVGPGQVKENITLAERPTGPVKFTFTLDTDGLVPKARKDGSIAFYGEAPDTAVLVIPAPYMTDAKKSASSPYGYAYSDKVSQRLTKSGKNWTLTLTPDAKWLGAEDRRYPVVIDPTIAIAPTPTDSQDVMISSDGPASNYDGNWRLSVGNTTTGSSRALLKFPLTGVPAGTQVDSADLKLYYDQVHTTGASEVQLEAHRATAAWSESTATWNNANAIAGELSGTSVTVDDGDAGTTAAQGAWPASGSSLTQYAIGTDYHYNKDSVTGDTYTWQPSLPEDGDYQVEAHYVPASDRATNAPYTVTHDGGTTAYSVNQQAGTGGVWKTLGTHPFQAGTAGKVVLGDGPASTSTSVIADAVRLTKGGVVTKKPDEQNTWHEFSVTKTVQSWVDGTNTNYGFVVKAGDETSNGPKGGPRYEASEFAYGGEVVNYPKLVLTYGRPGVTLDAPTTIHATGAELNWSAYTDPSTATGDDIVEYQVHRSIYQTFTPSAATLVAPLTPGTTSYTDTTATPTAADSPDPYGRGYYYMVAVKTKDGEVTAAPTQLVRLPKAGSTTKVYQAGQSDTTLSSTESTTAHDTIDDAGVPRPWLSVGNNSATYGKTRALVDFPALDSLPATARVLDSHLQLWGVSTTTDTAGATYELHALDRDFDEATASWTKADATTNWTTPGGDYSATVSGTVGGLTNDPSRRNWDTTSLAQEWISTPSTNHGALVKLADESSTGPQERSMFLSSEADEQRLRPKLVVTYIDKTTDSTYYAPATPARMTPNTTYTVDVTLTNTTTSVWTAADQVLSYTWALPDGTDATTGGNQLQTALPKDIVPGETVTIPAQLTTPINSDSGSKRTEYVLAWDLYNKTAATWLSATESIPGLAQPVAVEDPTSNQLGLEKFYSYTGKNTGAGSTVMNNLAAGNSVWSYNAFTNPGRGFSTFTRFAYNSLDTSDTVLGHGWSAQAAGPLRLGAPLDFHPNPNPTEVRMPDGDGTTHVFRWDATNSVWKAPAGVHYLLEQNTTVECTPDKDNAPDAWSMTRPDRTQFFFDCSGYLTSVVDKNGNTQTYTYEERKSNNKPTKFLKYITDPASRQSLTVDYYLKGDASYEYIDDTGAKVTGSNLTNSKIYDHIKSVTDISGRKISFYYTTEGLLGRFDDGDGSSQPKTFKFTYDATQGTKNVKLVKATDPRGNATNLAYYDLPDDNPKYHWWSKTITDRLNGTTGFTYAANVPTPEFTDTVVTDAENHSSTQITDDYGRPVQTTNAKSQTSKLSWDADNNVTRLEEPNGAVSTFTFDAKTGYPLTSTDAEANNNGTASTTYTYSFGNNGYVADLFQKKSPEGRTWQFGYDTFGNLTAVTDPKGVATTTVPDDYTTTYAYDAYGQLTTATDANGNPTTNSDFGLTGYPNTITDPLNKSTAFVYDERGQVTEVTDALGKTTTQTYDTFGRPLVSTVPKDQAAGDLITTPAPVYDANDNITQSTAPNGAVSTAVYDAADQVTEATAPKDTATSDERKATYTYDTVGNLLKTTEPKGNLTPADPNDYITTNTYDEIYQVTDVTNAAGDKISYTYDTVGNPIKVVDPKKNATTDPDDYTTKTAYDLNHRVTTVTDAAGKTTSTTYDKDSLVVATKDAENNETLITYDERGKTTEAKVPHSGTTTITYRTTKYEYDQVGNTTKVITPRGVETAETEDFASRTEYDALNRPVKQYQPYDPADTRYNDPGVYTQTVYDAVGRVEKTSMPPSEGQSVRNDTSYGYFDNGWAKSSTDPWDITATYDYNPIGKQTARTLTSAGGSSSRTMGWDFYPDGKLKSRTDDGVPAGQDVVLVDNSDTQNTFSTGTWTTGDAYGQQGYDHQTHVVGTGTDAFTWTLNIPKDGTYTAYAKYPAVTGAATTAKYIVTNDSGSTDKTIDQTQNAGDWVSLGSFTFTQGNTSKITLAENSGGVIVADAVKLVRDITGETDTEAKTFTYAYDANANLTDITDTSSSATIDAYKVAYTGLNQADTVEELASGVVKETTSYTYDANSLTKTVTNPDQYSAYTYDLRDLVSKVSVGDSPTDPAPKDTTYTYTDRRQKLRETKANNNTVDYTYFLDGALKTQVEKKSNGTLVSEHTYAYDSNGNKAQDVAQKMNADNNTAYLSSTTDYTYDPVNRLAKSVKTGNGAGTDSYVHDNNANVISQTVKDVPTTYTYDRNRLLSASAEGTTASYNYDPYGRLDSVTGAGQVIERNTYDGFDHVIEHTKLTDTGSTTTKHTLDPLDRTASKTANVGATGEKTTYYDYLGLSNEILDEEVAGQITKSYQYSPWGERLSQIKHNTDGTTEDGYYGYNSHTDVETLTDGNGDTKATYGYTAYGKDDESEFTGIDKLDPTDPTKEPYNPYRYNAKRWDAASGTYDMGFRNYNPGLNRFTTRDMYNGALADMRLGTDSYTGNRYAFTGGNPTSRIEKDGHDFEQPDPQEDIEGWAAWELGQTTNASDGAWLLALIGSEKGEDVSDIEPVVDLPVSSILPAPEPEKGLHNLIPSGSELVDLFGFENWRSSSTFGACRSGSAGYGTMVNKSNCLLVTHDPNSSVLDLTSWDIGYSESIGVSGGVAGGVSGGFELLVSNADDMGQLAGWGWSKSGSGYYGLGGSLSHENALNNDGSLLTNNRDEPVWSWTASGGAGAGGGVETGINAATVCSIKTGCSGPDDALLPYSWSIWDVL